MHRPWETPTEPTPFVRWLRACGWPSLILAVAWALTGQISFLLDVDYVLVTPAFFFPEAFSLAFALRFGACVWPGIFVGHQLLILGSGLPVMAGLGVSAANTLEAVLAVWLFRRLRGKSDMDNVRSWILLQAMVFLVLQPFCAALGTGSLFASGVIGDHHAWLTAGLNWWSGSGMAQSQLAPLLLILLHPRARVSWVRQIVLPALVTAAVLACALFVLGGGVGTSLVVFQPLLIAFALLLGLPAVCAASVLVSVAFLYATSHGWGPFYLGDATSLFDLNVFLIGISLMGQFLAVLFRQLAKQRKTEEELRDAREQLQRTAYELTEHIPVGTYVLEFDAKGEPHFTFLSERFLAMTGLKRHEVMANHALALQPMNTAGRKEIERINREVFAKKERFFWEGEITVRGEERNVTLESVPRSRPGGGTIWEGVLTDITERKRAEKEQRLIFDNLPIAVAVNTLTSPAEITYINEQFTRIFGYTLDEVPTIAMWAEKAYPDPNYRREIFREWDEAVFHAIETKGSVRSMEFEVTCKDGAKRDIVFRAVALDGNLLVSMIDVTERKRAEQQLTEANLNMQLAASAAHLGFWELDVETGLDRWDDEMARIHGITLAEFDGHWEKFVHPEDHDEVMSQTRQMLASDRIFEMEYRILRPDGEVRHIREHGIVIRDEEGRPLRASGVMQDITAQKNAVSREKELEAHHRRDLENKLKTSLAAAAVAHEINQPLSAILLRTKMALEEKRDGMEALSEVATEAQRVVTTIEKMKTLMRSVQTQHRAIDLGAVVRSALLYNKTMLARHKVGVQESGLQKVCTIMGDDEQLQLAITNILRNAAEAIDDSAAQQREISIDLAVKNNEVVLTIGDSGPGWSGAESAETPLTTTKKGGTGIGLYVARTAMENHRGKIVFGRSPLGGAEVKLVFPRDGAGS
jgi:PAS domain S-box-containing protein